MDLIQLKLELLEKIVGCDDDRVLKKIEQILKENISEVKEEEEPYISEVNDINSPSHLHFEESAGGLDISPEQEEELAIRYERYLQNGGKSYNWEEVRKEIRAEHGF